MAAFISSQGVGDSPSPASPVGASVELAKCTRSLGFGVSSCLNMLDNQQEGSRGTQGVSKNIGSQTSPITFELLVCDRCFGTLHE